MSTNTNKKRVLVIQPLHAAGMARLEQRDDIEIIQCDSLDEHVIAEAAKDVHAMTVRAAKITKRIMDAAPDLMVVSRHGVCLLYTSPSPRDGLLSRMPSSA